MDRGGALDSQAVVISVFRQFRPELLSVFGNSEFTRKQNSSQVTEWDVMLEERLRFTLEKQFPDYGFEGEETGIHGNRDHYWLVDPIDGTSSFIRGLPFATNMAAFVEHGEVIASVIYDFVLDDIYTAVKGEGAYKNGQPIHINADRRAGNLLLYSFTRQQFPLYREALSELGMRTVLPVGAAGHTYTLLAEGKIDGIIALHTRMGFYDNAAGVLLAEEAGAQLLQYDDKTGVERHEFIIGTPYVVEKIERSGLI